MRYVYTVFLYLISPLIVLRLYWKSRRLPAYRQRLSERFSWGAIPSNPVDVWVHAVSLGEVVAATPLVEALLNRGLRVMVTTMTPTGSQQVINRFGGKVAHQYVPYDFPWAVVRFLKKVNPKLAIILETELWPNLIAETARRSIPLLLVNARLSNRAFKQYHRVRFLFKPILNQLTTILAQSEEDARRFISLGATPSRVKACGNIKFDIEPVAMDTTRQEILTHAWGRDRVVVIAASTHADEENQLLSQLAILKRAIPEVLFLIAPRHPERFEEVYRLSQQSSFKTGLRSKLPSIDPHVEVIILDSLGELSLFYSLSHYAFVGGSLVPIGGHNVLEPIAAQVPVFCGPYMNNSQSICDSLCDAQAIKIVKSANDLMLQLICLHQNSQMRDQQIHQATIVLNTHRGALDRCLDEVESMLERVSK